MGDYEMGDSPEKWCVYKERGKWWAHPSLVWAEKGIGRGEFTHHADALRYAFNCADFIAWGEQLEAAADPFALVR